MRHLLRLLLVYFAFVGIAVADDGPLKFTDITKVAGTGGPMERNRLGGHGVIWSDVDDDGRPDLYITMIFDDPMPELFFWNVDGRRFAEEGLRRGIADFDGGSHGACFADLDNDGDYDLFNGTTWDHPQYPCFNNVFRNDDGRFMDVTGKSRMLHSRKFPTRGVLTFDMDQDGDLDLFCVTNYQGSKDPPGEVNELYRNVGALTFEPIDASPVLSAPCGQGATDSDFDGDGDIDIIAANRTGPVNILRNDGTGNFDLVPPESIGIRHRAEDGITLADIDNDGDLDALLAGNDIGHLYRNRGRGKFTFLRSFKQTDGYMGGFADLDNDTDVDLVFAGDDVCYINNGSGHFEAGPKVPVDGIDDPRGMAFADIDADGDVDFAIGCKRSRNWLVRNDLDAGNWVKVRLISPDGQAGAFGAKVEIRPIDESEHSLIGFREARGSNGYLGQDDPVMHFGLGDHREVRVIVTFLDGTAVEREGVPGHQVVIIDGREREKQKAK